MKVPSGVATGMNWLDLSFDDIREHSDFRRGIQISSGVASLSLQSETSRPDWQTYQFCRSCLLGMDTYTLLHC